MTDQSKPANPYVGPRAFQTGEKLFGRDREIRQLVNLQIAERIVLLHSPSGAGKSSLVQAGFIPKMREEGFLVLPVVRVNSELPPELRQDGANRYITSTLLALLDALPEKPASPAMALEGQTLAGFVTAHFTGAAEEDRDLVLVFDQFEEILTIDPTDREGKTAFFTQLGELLLNRNCWALFAMREDYVSALDPYLRYIPTRLNNKYRLDLLEARPAVEAIRKPAGEAGVEFEENAAQEMVSDLCRVQVQLPDGSFEVQPGLYVEPLQLQVVCYRLWEKLAPGTARITEQMVESTGDVDQSLAEYYDSVVDAVVQESGARARVVRAWFDRQLITDAGLRGQVLMGKGQSAGLDNAVIQRLVDAHLVRAEKRGNATWFELSHDRLIRPVRERNAAWFHDHLSLLQQQAEVWSSRDDRPDSLLLRGKELDQAKTWAAAHPLDLLDREKEFLNRSLRARDMQQQVRRRNIIIGVITMLAVLVGCCLMAYAGYQGYQAEQQRKTAVASAAEAKVQRDLAEKRKDEAEASKAEAEKNKVEADRQRDNAVLQERLSMIRGLTNEVELLSKDNYDLALLLAVETSRLSVGDSPAAVAAKQGILKEVNWLLDKNRTEFNLRAHTGWVNDVVFTPDGRYLLSAGDDGQIVFWDVHASVALMNGEPIRLEGKVASIAVSPDSKTLAASVAGTGTNQVRLLDVKTRTLIGDPLDTGGDSNLFWRRLAFSQDGTYLAAGSSSGDVCVWKMNPLDTACKRLGTTTGDIWDLHFNPLDSNQLATGDYSGYLYVWDVQKATKRLAGYDPQGFLGLDYQPDGQRIATGSGDGTVRIWDANGKADGSSPPLLVMKGHQHWAIDVAFHPWANTLASVSGDGTLRLWDSKTGAALPGSPVEGYNGKVITVAFSSNGDYIATGHQDGLVRLVRANPTGRYRRTRLEGQVYGAALSPDGRWMIMELAGALQVFDVETLKFIPHTVPTQHPAVIKQIVFSPDGKHILTISPKGDSSGASEVRFWQIGDIAKAEITPLGKPYEFNGEINIPGFSPDNKVVALGDRKSGPALMLVDPLGANTTKIDWTDPVPMEKTVYSADGSSMALISNQYLVSWDRASNQMRCSVLAHENPTLDLAFSPDGKTLATTSLDSTVRLWDAQTCKELPGSPLMRHHTKVEYVTFSHSGKFLATLDESGLLVLWNLASRASVAEFQTGIIAELGTRMAFSQDDANILTYDPGLYSSNSSDSQVIDRWPVAYATQNSIDMLQHEACRRVSRNLTPAEWQAYFPGVSQPEQMACPEVAIIEKLSQADRAALRGEREKAAALFAEIAASPPEDWKLLNTVCWLGALDSAAKEVLPICERAVEAAQKLDESQIGQIRDSRGVARAATGDYLGAAEDFQAFIDWSQNWSNMDDLVKKRRAWVDALKAKKNPFEDLQVLKDLRNE